MKYQEYIRSLCVLVALIAFLGMAVISMSYTKPAVVYIDALNIGQGDATLLTFHNGVQLLIDTGPGDSVVKELSQTMPWLDTSIDAVLLTHEDKDHIGGLLATLNAYTVGTVLHNGHKRTTATAKQNAAAIEILPNTALTKGDKIKVAGYEMEVLWPDRVAEPDDEPNMFSLVVILHLKNHSIVFMGDAPHSVEMEVMKDITVPVSVLKVGHHGSRTSSLPVFVQKIDPEIALISTAKGNRYGHPHKEVLDVLKGVDIRQTAQMGRIHLTCDENLCL